MPISWFCKEIRTRRVDGCSALRTLSNVLAIGETLASNGACAESIRLPSPSLVNLLAARVSSAHASIPTSLIRGPKTENPLRFGNCVPHLGSIVPPPVENCKPSYRSRTSHVSGLVDLFVRLMSQDSNRFAIASQKNVLSARLRSFGPKLW